MSKLTVQQALALTKAQTAADYYKNVAAQARRWYKKGYYMKADGLWYTDVGGKEFRKYYTGG